MLHVAYSVAEKQVSGNALASAIAMGKARYILHSTLIGRFAILRLAPIRGCSSIG